MEKLVEELVKMLSIANDFTPEIQQAMEEIIHYTAINSKIGLGIAITLIVLGIIFVLLKIFDVGYDPDIYLLIGLALLPVGFLVAIISINTLIEVTIAPKGFILKMLLP